jgi:choline dehydrogenase-like flavoprotein
LAAAEVVLAAGTIKTPQILELSGIGDAKLLKIQSIEVLIDNSNVGENLQDHGYIPFCWEVTDDQVSGDILRIPEVAGAAIAAYQTAKTSPLSGVPIVSALMPLVDDLSDEIDNILSKRLDSFECKDFPSKKEQFAIIRELLRNLTSHQDNLPQLHFRSFLEMVPLAKEFTA